MPNRNENLAASDRSKPRPIPVEIVSPEREMPGSTANNWATPIARASLGLASSSFRDPNGSRLAIANTKPVTTRRAAVIETDA